MTEHNQEHDHSEAAHTHDFSKLSGKKIFWVTLLNAVVGRIGLRCN